MFFLNQSVKFNVGEIATSFSTIVCKYLSIELIITHNLPRNVGSKILPRPTLLREPQGNANVHQKRAAKYPIKIVQVKIYPIKIFKFYLI